MLSRVDEASDAALMVHEDPMLGLLRAGVSSQGFDPAVLPRLTDECLAMETYVLFYLGCEDHL